MTKVMLAVLAILTIIAGSVANFSPTKIHVASAAVGDVIASDNFESGNWVGGTGWLGGWQTYSVGSGFYSDDVIEVTPLYSPKEGSYHLHAAYGDCWAKRNVDLSGKSNLRLQFWARATPEYTSSIARCDVSPDGTNWWAVKTWIEDTSTYQFADIDLSPYTMSSSFWIRFSADYVSLYIDDMEIVEGQPQQPPPIDPTVIASDNFESGNWVSGTGWLGGWQTYSVGSGFYSDDVIEVTPLYSPKEGSYHLHAAYGDCWAKRNVDLSGRSNLRLQFWARATPEYTSSIARCDVSPDGTTWWAVKTWIEDNSTYQFADIDLSPYTMSSSFWIRFSADYVSLYIDDVKITTADNPPNQPSNTFPANATTNVTLMPILQSSAFSDPDSGDTHAASQWQIRTSSGSYSSAAFDTGSDTSHLASISVPSGKLTYSTTYYWHVRHQDNHGAWSEWSTETSFTTVVSANQPPNQPSNMSPANEASRLSLAITLSSSAFADEDSGDTHAASQWQIRTSSGSYSSPVFDSGTDTANLTAIDIHYKNLSYGSTFCWRVRHQDNHGDWSDWSNATSFATMPYTAATFNFVVITDIHIGYDGYDYAARLTKVVNEINKLASEVALVAVLGDIANSAKQSELTTGKNILDQLKVPYVPLIGNHDVQVPGGGKVFGDVFAEQFDILHTVFGETWSRDTSTEPLYLQNYVFRLGGVSFICLDTVSRESCLGNEKEAGPDAVLSDQTKSWLRDCLSQGQATIILSHHPFLLDPISAFGPSELSWFEGSVAAKKPYLLANYAGHNHDNDEVTYDTVGMRVITTEAVARENTGPAKWKTWTATGENIRIVRVTPEITIGDTIIQAGIQSSFVSPESVTPQVIPADWWQYVLAEVGATTGIMAELHSPGELRVVDSQGRVTGLVNGDVKADIPHSAYHEGKVIVLGSDSSCLYEVMGTAEGPYGLTITSQAEGEERVFTATSIPISVGDVHRYTIDWEALSRGEKGVTVQIDSNGDGKFESTVNVGNELTRDDFVSATSKGGLPFWIWIIVGVGALGVVGGGILIWRSLAKKPVAVG